MTRIASTPVLAERNSNTALGKVLGCKPGKKATMPADLALIKIWPVPESIVLLSKFTKPEPPAAP